MQDAYDYMQQCWARLASARARLDVDINRLKSEMDATYAYKEQCFSDAKICYEANDHARAAYLSAEGKAANAKLGELKGYRDGYISQKNNLGEISLHARAKSDWQFKRSEWQAAKRRSDARMTEVQQKNKMEREELRRIAERADVPWDYLDNVSIVQDRDDSSITVIFYGGPGGKPGGPGCGMRKVNRSGEIIYRREPK